MFIHIDTTRKLKYNAYIEIKKVGEIMSVGSRIKELRENKGLSRGELANLLGVTVGSISNYENEVSSPKEPILFKIMDVLKCDANYLFQDALDMPTMKNSVSVDEYAIVKKYRDLDDHGREMVDFTLNKEYKRSKDLAEQEKRSNDNIVEMPSHLEVNAAHHSKGEFTDEERQEDEDMLD